MSNENTAKIISGLLGLALLAAGIYLLTIEREIWGAALLTGAAGTLGLPRLQEPKRTPEPPGRDPEDEQ